jgi:hypothetical protein
MILYRVEKDNDSTGRRGLSVFLFAAVDGTGEMIKVL